MTEFLLQPSVYTTAAHISLRGVLEDIWIRGLPAGTDTIYLVSGFANFNGGARFYRQFREFTESGGTIYALFGASASQNMTSKQVVEALLECGAQVRVVNRKGIMHAKLYGFAGNSQALVITSGNFTGPGMSRNVEASILVTNDILLGMNFSWTELIAAIVRQGWQTHELSLADPTAPGWALLYDETTATSPGTEVERVTMVVVLGHADTARIQAAPGTNAAKGTQYFWLSKDAFDFFPALTLRNRRGIKGTLSTLIELKYVDLNNELDTNCRVTFEAENNLDFRLGTGRLRSTRLAQIGDLACISRIADSSYELRLIRRQNPRFNELDQYAINIIGHQGKRFGYIDNERFQRIIGEPIGR